MERENKTSVQKITEVLHKLAILKNQVRTPEQLIAMATYLDKHFSVKEVIEASEYFLQREQFFPGIDRYFAILKPAKDLNQIAIDKYHSYRVLLGAYGYDYKEFKKHCERDHESFIKIVGWSNSFTVRDKDAIEIFKGIINKKEFYLGVNNENAQIEQ